jgi:hypothetical protein
VAVALRGSSQRRGGGSPVGAATLGVGGGGLVRGGDRSRLDDDLVWRWPEGCGSP